MSMSNIFEEYAVVESEIAALELKKEQLRPFILKKMIEEGMDKVDTAVGKFTVEKRKTWTYPEEIVALGEDFKAAQEKAKSTGEATYEEKEGLKFTKTKL